MESPLDPTTPYMAQLIGPTLLAFSLMLMINFKWLKKHVVKDFLKSPAVIMITGVISFVVGLAMVLNHNIWELARPTLALTILSWFVFVKGIFHMLFPEVARCLAKIIFGDKFGMNVC